VVADHGVRSAGNSRIIELDRGRNDAAPVVCAGLFTRSGFTEAASLPIIAAL